MTSALIQVNFIPKRMLTKAEAAHHCGRSVKRFEVECPAVPVAYPNGDRRWDVKDLDAWIDSLKTGSACVQADDIVERLA